MKKSKMTEEEIIDNKTLEVDLNKLFVLLVIVTMVINVSLIMES